MAAMLLLPLLALLVVPDEGSELLKRLPTINNGFGIRFFKEVTAVDKNTLLSPYGLLSALGMVYKGSNGLSYDEVTKSLHLGLPGQDLVGATLHLALKEFRSRLEDEKTSKMYLANRLFSQEGYGIRKAYKKGLRYYYGTTVEELDFLKKPTESINRINSWVMGETDFKIRSTVEPPLKNDLSMILVNGAYFKGDWEQEFSEGQTITKPFRTDERAYINVEMMEKEMEIKYCHSTSLRSKAIRLAYKGDGLSMVIFLPEEISGVERLVRELSEKSVAEVFAKLKRTSPKKVQVQLPKFSLEETHDLKDQLITMGMASLFNKNADFSLINLKSNMKLTDAVQKVHIKADEKGTEAAANFDLTARAPSRARRPKYSFHANHPFLFLITKTLPDNPELILFIGKVIHPSV